MNFYFTYWRIENDQSIKCHFFFFTVFLKADDWSMTEQFRALYEGMFYYDYYYYLEKINFLSNIILIFDFYKKKPAPISSN